MKNYCIFRFEKLKSKSSISNSLKHTFREIETKNADSSIGNEILKGGSSSKDVMNDYNNRLKEILGDKKPRKNAVFAIETLQSFSPEMIKNIDLEEWKKSNLLYLENTFGKENVISVVLHLDEKTPHISSIILPIDGKNKLNCREITKRENLIKYQDTYAREMEKHALERGKKGSKVKHKTPKKFYEEYNNICKMIEKNQNHVSNILENDYLPEKGIFENNTSYKEKINSFIFNLKKYTKTLLQSYGKLKLENNLMSEKLENMSNVLRNKENTIEDLKRGNEILRKTLSESNILTDEEYKKYSNYKEKQSIVLSKKEDLKVNQSIELNDTSIKIGR